MGLQVRWALIFLPPFSVTVPIMYFLNGFWPFPIPICDIFILVHAQFCFLFNFNSGPQYFIKWYLIKKKKKQKEKRVRTFKKQLDLRLHNFRTKCTNTLLSSHPSRFRNIVITLDSWYLSLCPTSPNHMHVCARTHTHAKILFPSDDFNCPRLHCFSHCWHFWKSTANLLCCL